VNAAESRAAERFAENTSEHELTVLRDDGLYRHLRFQKPGTSIYYFDLVTWPGYLAIVGDAGDYLFRRTQDMFEFFSSESDRINPRYWSEKLQGPGYDLAREYSHDALRTRVLEWGRQHCEEWGDGEMVYTSLLAGALEREILADYTHSEEAGRAWLAELEEVVGDLETWEWDLREFDGRFLWCCWAIVWGIEQYRFYSATEKARLAVSR
jgi:hypothetical protein